MAKVTVQRLSQRASKDNQKFVDSFQNFALGLGIGTNQAQSGNTYGFNPKTRIRTELEWAHRGTFMAGVAVDIIADDMTREGVDILGDLKPDQIAAIDELATTLKLWNKLCAAIKWGRLYGGTIAVHLIKGQDYSTPLRVDSVGRDQYKGLLVLDRWQVTPSMNDLITEEGPDLGLPKYYHVEASAPALRGKKIHYSRVIRLLGDELPYYQSLAEMFWGASVLERPFDRMSGFDAATMGATQQVHKSYLRYFKIEKYRDILGGAGGPNAYKGLQEMIAQMRLFASNEGIVAIDAKDDMVTQQAQNFTGISDVLLQLGQHLSGNWQIPLVRLFGQSPAGLNATGEADLKTYYDNIRKRQVQDLLIGVTIAYRLMAQSLGIKAGKGFGISFRPLWQMSEGEKSEVAAKDTQTAMEVHSAGAISDKTLLEELQHISRRTGRWQSITGELVDGADEEVGPPEGEMPPASEGGGESGGFPKPKVKQGEEPVEPKMKDADGAAVARRNIFGINVEIENPRGSVRVGQDWQTIMPYDYGYIPGVTGADGDSLDACVGPNPSSLLVFVVDQQNFEGGFDEHKVMLGYSSEIEALDAYRRGHHRAADVFISCTPMNIAEFKRWMRNGDLSKPLAEAA